MYYSWVLGTPASFFVIFLLPLRWPNYFFFSYKKVRDNIAPDLRDALVALPSHPPPQSSASRHSSLTGCCTAVCRKNNWWSPRLLDATGQGRAVIFFLFCKQCSQIFACRLSSYTTFISGNSFIFFSTKINQIHIFLFPVRYLLKKWLQKYWNTLFKPAFSIAAVLFWTHHKLIP